MLNITTQPNELGEQTTEESGEQEQTKGQPQGEGGKVHQGTDPDNPDFNDTDSEAEKPQSEAKEKEETPEWKKQKHKVKIDDEEMEVDYDELTKGYQRMQAAQKRFQEAAKIKKEIEAKEQRIQSFMEGLEKSPEQLLQKVLGRDRFMQLAEQAVWSQIQQEKSMEGVPPEMREKLARLQELEAREQEWQQREQQEQEARAEQQRKAEIAQHRQKLEQEIAGGLQQFGSDLPATPETLRRAAFYVQSAMTNGIPVDMQDITQQVRDSYIQEHKNLVAKMQPEQLYKLFGEDTAKKIREYDLGRLKSPTATRTSVEQETTKTSKRDKRPFQTWDEFMRNKG